MIAAPHFDSPEATVWHGDCIEVMRTLPDASVDAVVTDPPYGLNFMGQDWDNGGKMLGQISTNWSEKSTHSRGYADNDNRAFQAWCELWATEALRVLKPGGHLLAFGGTRTFHRLTAGIEDAGLEIRDSIAWMYGSGFPKSLDVSKAIDKQLGAERTVLDTVKRRDIRNGNGRGRGDGIHAGARGNGPVEYLDHAITAPGSDEATAWQGWGTALKPAFEPIVVARKPLTGTVATNVLAYGTGALNIDGCRIGTDDNLGRPASDAGDRGSLMVHDGSHGKESRADSMFRHSPETQTHPAGRWPANVVLDEHQAAALDRMVPVAGSNSLAGGTVATDGLFGTRIGGVTHDTRDAGGASRFFYTAKASTDERPSVDGIAHPTVKPLDLMRWLVRLVTPKGGTVLEPFAGSGTTVEACIREGFRCIAIERETTYLPLIMQRLDKPHAVGFDFGDWDGVA